MVQRSRVHITNLMDKPASFIFLTLAFIFVIGSLLIEFRSRTQNKGYLGTERRRTRKVSELEPLGEQILKETEEMLDRDKLATRDGLKFIMKMMQELYIADMRRTLKMNELVEQFEVLRHKSLVSWIEDHKKFSLFLVLNFLALIVPEIRQPILRYALAQIGVQIP